MTRKSITAVLASLLVGLFIKINAPAVGACELDSAGNCAAAPGRDFTTQQIAAFDALTAIAPGATMADWYPISNVAAPCITDGEGNCAAQVAAGDGQAEYDTILTAMEKVGTATTIPVDANLTGPAGEAYQQMTTWAVNF
jgi:hypothetical protein